MKIPLTPPDQKDLPHHPSLNLDMSPDRMSRFNSPPPRWLVALLFSALLALRVLSVLHYRIDSDEPQHLHVVWGWAHLLTQYRDVFDNHTPLFHLASLPFYQWIGECGDTLLYMRFLMVPLFFYSLWCVYRLGVGICSVEVGIWAAILGALTPAFCYTFTEYRADDLWTALWYSALVVLLEGKLSWQRGFFAGVLIGATLAASLKTLALLGCFAGAGTVACYLTKSFKAALGHERNYRILAATIAGSLIVPALLTIWFSHLHALADARYGIFTYNAIPGFGRFRTFRAVVVGFVEFVAALAILIPLSHAMAERLIAPERRLRFHLAFLGSGFYGALIYTLWPLLDAEHLIPYQPLFLMGLTPLLLERGEAIFRSRRFPQRVVVPTAIAVFVIALEAWSLRVDQVKHRLMDYAELLRLSDANDYVMDMKGESIFRPRPYPYLLEGIGILRAKSGLMPDDIPERLIATGTCIVVPADIRFTFPRAIAFMNDNYILVGQFRVLGNAMTPTDDGTTFTFQVRIPQTFAFVSNLKLMRGMIDGQPCPGFATLTAGRHVFVPESPHETIDFVWKQAIDRGFYPRHKKREVSAN